MIPQASSRYSKNFMRQSKILISLSSRIVESFANYEDDVFVTTYKAMADFDRWYSKILVDVFGYVVIKSRVEVLEVI